MAKVVDMQTSAGVSAYTSKPLDYFGSARRDFVAAAPDNPLGQILELGCGTGDTGELALQSGKCIRYVGIELNPDAAAIAKTKITDVLQGDIESMEIPFPDSQFDALIMSEVLEHLQDPWRTVNMLERFQ